MAILGLLLLVAAGVFLVDVWLSSTDPASFSFFGMSSSMTVGQAMLVGAIAGVVGTLGLLMLFGGIGHAARRRREAKREVRTTRGEAEELRAENERLAEELREREARMADATNHTTIVERPTVVERSTVAESRGVGSVRDDSYIPRHTDEPVAYPDEPVIARDDVSTGSMDADRPRNNWR
jgi:uncharacterized integral membrane protein